MFASAQQNNVCVQVQLGFLISGISGGADLSGISDPRKVTPVRSRQRSRKATPFNSLCFVMIILCWSECKVRYASCTRFQYMHLALS